jgi:predicted NBD/HSP70 family sugar kinase
MRIGIDLGGTKIEVIALDHRGNELLRLREASPRDNYPATVRAVVRLVRHVEQVTARSGTVGIGIPGAISRATGLVKNANSTWLIGKPFREDITTALGRDVRVENDANCFVVSEAVDGAARGANLVFGLIVGTGTGGGLFANGRLLRGRNHIAGEWGHNPLPWPHAEELPGPTCYCGKCGCIETWLSGPGFARDYQTNGGGATTAAGIASLAEEGEALAMTCLARYEDRMARSLATVINVLDPEVIVLGGGMSNIARLYDHVPRLWKLYCFSDRVDTRLVKPLHGDSSGVRGAAWLWETDIQPAVTVSE